MKKIIAITALVILAGFSQVRAQETKAAKDTMSLDMFSHLEKGDVLPYKYVYQKARVGTDTVITCSVGKNLELEVVENNKEEEYVLFDVITTRFIKTGEECNDFVNIKNTCVVDDGFPIRLKINYYGDGEATEYPDTLKARVEKNIKFMADTLAQYNPDLTKEQIAEGLNFMAEPNFALTQAACGLDLGEMFRFYRWIFVEDEPFVHTDSLYCDIDQKNYEYKTFYLWDSEFSKEVPDYKEFYVLRSMLRISGNPALSLMNIPLDEEDLKLLEDEDNQDRCVYTKEVTLLADKAMGVPALVDVEIIQGFYGKIGDQHFCIEKIFLALDFEKLMGDESDDEEEEDDGETHYDDYGFIKVK